MVPPHPKTLWGQIEHTLRLRPNLHKGLLSTPLGSNIPPAISPTIKALAHEWEKLIQNNNNDPTISTPILPIEVLHHLSQDISLNHWAQKGIKSIQHLFQRSQLKKHLLTTARIQYIPDRPLHLHPSTTLP